jgi:hypothetical protein
MDGSGLERRDEPDRNQGTAARKILNRPQGRGSADVVKAAAAIARYYERMALRAKYPGPRTHDAMNLKAFIPDPEYAARVEAFRMLKRGTRLFPTLADLSRIELTYNAMSALGCLSLLLVTLFAVATPFVLLKRYGVLVFIPAIIICLLAWVIVIVGFDSTPNEKIKEVQRNLYSFVSGNYD